jgi:hypothetical protein
MTTSTNGRRMTTHEATVTTPPRRSSRRRTSEAPRTPDLVEGAPCSRDGCTLYWPRWHDGQPKCKVCARDESLAALAAQGGLTQEARQGGVVT